MSDPAVQRYDNKEDIELVLSNKNARESCYPFQSQWVAHWMGASSSSTSCKLFTVCDARYQDNIENMKSKETKILGIGMNRGKTSANKNGHRAQLNEIKMSSDVYRSTESVRVENGQCKIMNKSVVQKKMKLLDAKAAVSDTLSFHKLPDSSVEWEKLDTYLTKNLENGRSELNHFPMFDINCKIESILNPRKRSAHGVVIDRLSEPQILLNETKLAPHAIEFASEEQQLKAERMTQKDRQIESCKSIKDFLPPQDDCTGSISYSAIEMLKFFGPDMGPCNSSKRDSDPSSSEQVFKENSLYATLTSLEHVFSNISNLGTFMMSESKGDDKIIACDFKRSRPRFSSGTMQIPREGDFSLRLLAREHNEELLDASGSGLLPSQKRFLGLNRLDDMGSLHHSLHQMPNCPLHDVETLRVQTTLNTVNKTTEGSQKLSNAANYMLITKKTNADLSHGEQMIEKSMDSAKVKGSPSFEMSTLPTVLLYNGMQCEDLQPLVKSSNLGDREDGNGTDTHFLETQNDPSFKTNTMYIGAFRAPSSPAGGISSRMQEGVVCPKLSKSKSTAASPINQAVSKDAETELHYMTVEHPASSERTTSMTNRGMSTFRTESLDVDHILSHVEKPNNSSSTTIRENLACAEASNRWIKRLRHNPSDSLALGGTKRFKISDGQSSRAVGTLFGRLFNYSKPSSDSTKCPQEQQKLDKTILSSHGGVHTSAVLEKEMQSWIQRLCRNSPPAVLVQAKRAAPVLCEPEKKVIPENIDGKQLPSLAAMALMGKAMNNFQPCVFQKRGSSVVWRA